MNKAEAEALVSSNPLWYHTIEVAPGVVTPGWFDLRPAVPLIPWPDVAGKRVLDVATYDGFLAFELEKRGASQVVATDIGGHENWDWLPRSRALGPEHMAQAAGEKGRGFEVAKEILGSKVEKTVINIYDLSPETIGTFDVVVLGSLVLHLRDPMRALEAVRSVCSGVFLSIEQIDPILSFLSPKRPANFIFGEMLQWMVPNAAGHIRMLQVAGFDILKTTKPFPEKLGPGHEKFKKTLAWHAGTALCRGEGVPCRAALAKPAF